MTRTASTWKFARFVLHGETEELLQPQGPDVPKHPEATGDDQQPLPTQFLLFLSCSSAAAPAARPVVALLLLLLDYLLLLFVAAAAASSSVLEASLEAMLP